MDAETNKILNAEISKIFDAETIETFNAGTNEWVAAEINETLKDLSRVPELLKDLSRLENLKWLQLENSGDVIWVNETSIRNAQKCRDTLMDTDHIGLATVLGWEHICAWLLYGYIHMPVVYRIQEN